MKRACVSALSGKASGVPERNLKLVIEYDGTHYAGWQIQNKHQAKTVQEVIEKTLHKILREKIKIIGSGRTDAGVHASGQVANCFTRSSIPLENLRKALNSLLPKDIVIRSVHEASEDFHARFQAKSKVYRYTILNRKFSSVFTRNYCYFYPYPLDVDLLRREARVLAGTHDFTSFQARDKKERSSIRTIKKIKVGNGGGVITVDIEANGFLYNMVRNIVGTLIEVGRGKLPAGSVKKILALKDRTKAGPTAPACGLCLMRVRY